MHALQIWEKIWFSFLVADTQLYKPLFGPSVHQSVGRSQSCFSRISASAHPSATNAAVYTALFIKNRPDEATRKSLPRDPVCI